MRTRTGSIHLEIQTSRKSPVGIIRSSYREGNQIKHKQFGRITGCTLPQLKLLQLAFQEKVVPQSNPDAFQIVESKEYGASNALLQIINQTGLEKIIYSRPQEWVKSVLAMIVGRIIFAGSKLSLCNQHTNTSLWEQVGISGKPDVEKYCYAALDELLSRQKLIQKKLAQTQLANSQLVLYDITSSYFEGAYTDSDLVKFGYNRDGKKGHAQIVIGLICTGDGCPVGVEVFPGNTKDESTVLDKIAEIKKTYEIKDIIFVSDRGMMTASNREAIKDVSDLHTITALTHRELVKLLERKVIQLNLFDEHHLHEVIDPDDPKRRYILCRNPVTAQREQRTRARLLELTQHDLNAICDYKKATTVEVLGSRIGKVLGKYKMGKFVAWSIEGDTTARKSKAHKIHWQFTTQKIQDEERFDGCYIITTDVKQSVMDEAAVVRSYKNLGHVEKAFRNMKTVQLEIRPAYHKNDDRIRGHVFLCMLAYFVQWQVQKKLQPLFESDGAGKNRRWTFENVIETLTQITRNKVKAHGAEFYLVSERTEEQQQILDLLEIKM